MSKLLGRSTATPSSSSAKLTKKRPVSDSYGSAQRPNISPVASSHGGSSSSSANMNSLSLVTPRTSLHNGAHHQPCSQTELYWASRALRSETLLAAQLTHHSEVRGILSSAEIKRAREIRKLKHDHDVRQSRLEAVALGLFLSLLFLALAVFYLLSNLPRQRIPETTRWSLPHHFTIPVLSPFTSVVESESAVIGARSIAFLVVVSGTVIYGLIRYWLINKSKN